jgi:undecaprenyl-diphosphatase
MHEYLASALLGLVQGLTEFLPVSSSGHLIITSALLGLEGDRIKIFEVAIQFGSILAVVLLYWQRFMGLLFPKGKRAFSGMRGLYLLFLTSLPASLTGLALHSIIKTHLFTPVSVALALAVGALFIFFAEWRYSCKAMLNAPTVRSLDDISPKMALGIGCFQCLSLWPGFSRSTSTIMGALLLGADRAVAAEYSFIAAVPILAAASGFSLISGREYLASADIPFFLIGALLAFVSALAAIKLFIGFVSCFSFRPFAWYRLIIAPLILWFWI